MTLFVLERVRRNFGEKSCQMLTYLLFDYFKNSIVNEEGEARSVSFILIR